MGFAFPQEISDRKNNHDNESELFPHATRTLSLSHLTMGFFIFHRFPLIYSTLKLLEPLRPPSQSTSGAISYNTSPILFPPPLSTHNSIPTTTANHTP